MKAKIVSYRRGRHTVHTNQFLIEIKGVDSRALASQFIGKRIVWKTPGKKEIFGKLTRPHGNRGMLRARFSKGLPGTALGTEAEIIEN